MRKVIYFVGVIFIISAFAACSGSRGLSTNPGDIQGDWQLTSMNGSETQMGESYTLSFNPDGTVAGKADCNYYTGKYNAREEGQVSMSSFSATKISCGSNSNASAFLNSLPGSKSFKVKGGDQLVLNTGSRELVFSKVINKAG